MSLGAHHHSASGKSLTSPPAKILLTTSTKISLHDRFTKLAKARPEVSASVAAAAAAAAKKSDSAASGLTASQASARNRRLALQMANRPTVKAALALKKKSIRQRLGGSSAPVAAGAATGPQVRRLNQQTPLKKRLSGGSLGIDPSRLSVTQNRKRPNLAQRLSLGNNRPIIRHQQVYVNSNRVAGRRRGGGNGLGLVAGGGVAGRRSAPINRPRGRGRGGSVVGKSGGQARPAPVADKTKQGLDMDLEQYMAKSKNHLDNDLDTYMQSASNN